MKKIYYVVILACMSMLLPAFPSFAGQWKQEENGQWWYQHDDGSYTTNGWEEIDGTWYYFYSDGYMAYDTWIGDYYVGSKGEMLKSTTTPDGKTVDENGKVVSGFTENDFNVLPVIKEGKYIEYSSIPRYSRTIKYVDRDTIIVNGYITAKRKSIQNKGGVAVVTYQASNDDIIYTLAIRSDTNTMFIDGFTEKRTLKTESAWFVFVE